MGIINTSNKIFPISKDKVISSLLLITAVSLFLFNETIRFMLNNSPLNLKYNLLFIFVGTLAIFYMFLQKNIDLMIVVLVIGITGFALIAIYSGMGRIPHYVRIIATISMPILITGFRLRQVDLEAIMRKFLGIFNIICILLVTAGVLDYLSGGSIQTYFANNMYEQGLADLVYREKSLGIYRYYSFIGHPLTNAWYLLLFYMFNSLYCSSYQKSLINEYLLIVITFIGLLLSGSRTALIIGIFMFAFLNGNKNKLAIIAYLSILCTSLLSSSLFQKNLLQRFIVNMASGNISGGRNEALIWVLKGFVKPPQFLFGGGISSSYLITANMDFIRSFEYPIIMLAYDIGILSTILIYLCIMIIPFLVILKNKSFGIMIYFVLITLYMNGFNSLASYSDFMGQACFVLMILINLSYQREKQPDKVEVF